MPAPGVPFDTCPLGEPKHHDAAAQDLLSTLPASYMTDTDDLQVPDLSDAYITQILNIDNLNDLSQWLWVAGRPRPPPPLYGVVFLYSQILISERLASHLVWNSQGIFIKPIPRFLLYPSFWTSHLTCVKDCACSDPTPLGDCDRRKAYKTALGLLFSYTALIAHESDFYIAQDRHFIPPEVTWPSWRAFVREILAHENIYQDISPRFVYGELDSRVLSRIMRWKRYSVKGAPIAKFGFKYGSFFREGFATLASITVFIAIVLTAMQVGLAVPPLSNSSAFQSVSYGFTVFSIVGPVAMAVVILYSYTTAMVYTWSARLRYKRSRLHAIRRRSEKS